MQTQHISDITMTEPQPAIPSTSTSISCSFVRAFTTPSPPPLEHPDGGVAWAELQSDPSISLDTLKSTMSSRQRFTSSHQITLTGKESDTSFGVGVAREGSSNMQYDYVSYRELDSGHRQEFDRLLQKESGWGRACLHRGLVVNLLFLAVMVVGIVLGEVYFPLEGVRGNGITFANDTRCLNATAACITVRIVRAIGVFGFLGGITNWIAIEMLFRSVPFLIGTGVIAKQHKEIRESIRQIVSETIFDPVALKQYFSGRKESIREMLHLEKQFGSLLNSEAANQIIDRKIEAALARPEGFVLAMMGVDHTELKAVMRRHVEGFISEISPTILDRMAAPGLTDGVGLQAEVERILEERIEELSSKKVKQLVAIMIRKHLSWLIVWGNVLGALLGLIAEVITISVTKTKLS